VAVDRFDSGGSGETHYYGDGCQEHEKEKPMTRLEIVQRLKGDRFRKFDLGWQAACDAMREWIVVGDALHGESRALEKETLAAIAAIPEGYSKPLGPAAHFPVKETRYGFTWGPLVVERTASDPKWGVVVSLATDYGRLEVRSSPNGRTLTAERKKKGDKK
jgi:hypothetical protein